MFQKSSTNMSRFHMNPAQFDNRKKKSGELNPENSFPVKSASKLVKLPFQFAMAGLYATYAVKHRVQGHSSQVDQYLSFRRDNLPKLWYQLSIRWKVDNICPISEKEFK